MDPQTDSLQVPRFSKPWWDGQITPSADYLSPSAQDEQTTKIIFCKDGWARERKLQTFRKKLQLLQCPV